LFSFVSSLPKLPAIAETSLGEKKLTDLSLFPLFKSSSLSISSSSSSEGCSCSGFSINLIP
jgi:hypothetical protein